MKEFTTLDAYLSQMIMQVKTFGDSMEVSDKELQALKERIKEMTIESLCSD